MRHGRDARRPRLDRRPGPRRWTVNEFDRLPEGFFSERIELVDGRIYTELGQGLAHITAVQLVFRALQATDGSSFNLSMGMPISIGESKLEPDVRILRGQVEDYGGRYPDPSREITLLVEVSETSPGYDLGPKLSAYAASGVPEHWILDLASRALQVCRSPRPERGEYAETVVYRGEERVDANGAQIEIVALLPRVVPNA